MGPGERAGAFDRLFADLHQPVHAYLRGRTGDQDAAADLTQETFLRTWRALDEVAVLAPDRQRAWIFTVARNLTIDHQRRGSTASATLAAVRTAAPAAAPVHEQPEPRAELAEQVAALDRAIGALPDKLRTTLTMNVLAGMSAEAIAGALGEPAGTIRYRLHQARRRLRAVLDRPAAPSTGERV